MGVSIPRDRHGGMDLWAGQHCPACGASHVRRYERLISAGAVFPEDVRVTVDGLLVCPACATLDPGLLKAKTFARRIKGETWRCSKCGYQGKEGPGHPSETVANAIGPPPPAGGPLSGTCTNLAERIA